MKVFSVYDSKAEAYAEPFVAKETAEGQRMFSLSVENEKTKIGKWPEDHTLFELGEWDERAGSFTPYEAKKNLGLASDGMYQPKPKYDPRQVELTDIIKNAQNQTRQ